MKEFLADGILSAEIIKRKEFYGFTNKKILIYKVYIQILLLKGDRAISEGIKVGKETNFTSAWVLLYLLRRIYERNIQAAGWVKIPM